VGGSYAGTMVAWFVQRHPELANGAWSSSAPLRAKVDLPEYKEVVGLAIRTIAGQPCYDRIQRAFTQIRDAMTASEFAMLDTEFNTCTSLVGASEFDRFNFLDSISHTFSGYVQYHSGTEILAACTDLINEDITNDISAFAAIMRKQLGTNCLSYRYQDMVDFLKATTWESDAVKNSCESFNEMCIFNDSILKS
jgi:Serine carboxypeptidase S28